MKAVM
jgi:hypothetical protein